MTEILFILYYSFLILGTLTGILRYHRLDGAMQKLVVLLAAIACFELIAYSLFKLEEYRIRNGVYHFATVIRIVLLTTYFAKFITPQHSRKLILLVSAFWLTLGTLNSIFVQPLRLLNSNMVMAEGFNTITLSLYSIYLLIKNDNIRKIFYYPHFWVATFWLLLASSTFFFWSALTVLYGGKWEHVQAALNFHAVVNSITYAGIAAILLFYPKMKRLEHR